MATSNNSSLVDVPLALPAILDGTFFKVVSNKDGKVIARCVTCLNKELSGAVNATSNFLRHLKVTTNKSLTH